MEYKEYNSSLSVDHAKNKWKDGHNQIAIQPISKLDINMEFVFDDQAEFFF